MATARRTGTNESISTYGSGQTYTALATWEADTDVDNVALTQSPVLACLAASYNDGGVSFSAATNSATYFQIIRPQAGNFHTGIRGTGVRFEYTSDNSVFIIVDEFVQLQDLVIKTTQSGTTARHGISMTNAAGGSKVIGCILTGSSNSGTGVNQGYNKTTGSTSTAIIMVDVLAENNEGNQFAVESSATVIIDFLNCTAIGGTNGFNIGVNAVARAVNCLGHGTSTADFAGSIDSGSNNASEDTTAYGTSPRTSCSFSFTNAAGFDYSLLTSDDDAKDLGTSLAADATFAFDDDIIKALWSTWDIGAFSVNSAAGGTPGRGLTRSRLLNGMRLVA